MNQKQDLYCVGLNSYKECISCGGYGMIQIAIVEDEEIYVKQQSISGNIKRKEENQ